MDKGIPGRSEAEETPVGSVGFSICAKCAYCQRGLEYKCKHPYARLRVSRMNPVTGRMVYKAPDDVGMYTSSSPYPRCSHVNPDGKCAVFKHRRSMWQVIMDLINPPARVGG